MKKGYHEYTPLVKEKKVIKKAKDMSGFVTTDIFELMFGYTYPKVYTKPINIESIKYPKTDGSNGKINRFR